MIFRLTILLAIVLVCTAHAQNLTMQGPLQSWNGTQWVNVPNDTLRCWTQDGQAGIGADEDPAPYHGERPVGLRFNFYITQDGGVLSDYWYGCNQTNPASLDQNVYNDTTGYVDRTWSPTQIYPATYDVFTWSSLIFNLALQVPLMSRPSDAVYSDCVRGVSGAPHANGFFLAQMVGYATSVGNDDAYTGLQWTLNQPPVNECLVRTGHDGGAWWRTVAPTFVNVDWEGGPQPK